MIRTGLAPRQQLNVMHCARSKGSYCDDFPKSIIPPGQGVPFLVVLAVLIVNAGNGPVRAPEQPRNNEPPHSG